LHGEAAPAVNLCVERCGRGDLGLGNGQSESVHAQRAQARGYATRPSSSLPVWGTAPRPPVKTGPVGAGGSTSVKESMQAPLWLTSTALRTSMRRGFDSHPPRGLGPPGREPLGEML